MATAVEPSVVRGACAGLNAAFRIYLVDQVEAIYAQLEEHCREEQALGDALISGRDNLLTVIRNAGASRKTASTHRLPPHLCPSPINARHGSSRRASVERVERDKASDAILLAKVAASSPRSQKERSIAKRNSLSGVEEHAEPVPEKRSASGAIRTAREARKQKEAKRDWLAIDPNSPRYWGWNFLILVLVLYSAVSVPVGLAFDVRLTGLGLGFAYFLELVFLCDLIINFHTGYFEENKRELEMRCALIRRHYLRGWFGVDLLSSVPTEAISSVVDTGNLSIMKILRLLKLFRLVRLLRLNSFTDSKIQGYVPPSLVRLGKLIFVFLLITHLVACVYWGIARDAQGFEIGSSGTSASYVTDTVTRTGATTATTGSSAGSSGERTYIEPCDSDEWLPLEKYRKGALFSQYTEAFYWALLVFLGSDMRPSNTSETSFT
jgi:hypothetical protein